MLSVALLRAIVDYFESGAPRRETPRVVHACVYICIYVHRDGPGYARLANVQTERPGRRSWCYDHLDIGRLSRWFRRSSEPAWSRAAAEDTRGNVIDSRSWLHDCTRVTIPLSSYPSLRCHRLMAVDARTRSTHRFEHTRNCPWPRRRQTRDRRR